MAEVGELLPPVATPIYGVAAAKMHDKLLELHAQHEGDNAWKPAVVLNLNPFPLRVENCHIQYIVAACPPDKDFSAFEITTPRIYTQYRGSEKNDSGGIERDYDLHAIPPIVQALEYRHVYSEGSETGRAMGGVVVFEGAREMLADGPKVEVREPYVVMNGRVRVVRYRKVLLAELIAQAVELQRVKALEMIQLGQSYFDSPDQKNKLTDEHREYARLAKRKQWITTLPTWIAKSTMGAKLCDACGQEYVSKTGKCKCGFVKVPLLAYKMGEIQFDHVRMDTLTPAEWKEAKTIKAQRDKAREQ